MKKRGKENKIKYYVAKYRNSGVEKKIFDSG